MTFLLASHLQDEPFKSPLTVLLDSGSTSSWFNHKRLPSNICGTTVESLTGTTMAGTFTSDSIITLRDVVLPEFRRNMALPELQARIFHADCRYDIILGRDALRHFRLTLDFNNNTIICAGNSQPMRPFPSVPLSELPELAEHLLLDHYESHLLEPPRSPNDEVFAPAPTSDNESSGSSSIEDDSFAVDILDSDYSKVDLSEYVRRCTHLSQTQQNSLFEVLNRHQTLFDGVLRVYTEETIHLDVDPTVPPKRSRAYPVAHSQLPTFKTELDRLVKIGVLEEQGRAEWISGTFIIKKKDNSVRWISDFRALNKALRRKVYPIPRIQDILSRRKGYKFLSKLDLSMQYYTFDLDEESRNLCTIATPFGLYRYCRLPMGVSQSPDIAQEVMERVLRAIDDIECYIDDIACFSNDFNDHMALLDVVFDRLRSHGFAINIRKCEFAIQETDFLGHWLTPSGIKPWSKKVDSIIAMKPPTSVKELRSFLGLVTYYRDMWPRRSHILAPLTDLLKLKKGTFAWPDSCQKAFEEMKAMVSTDALLAYPDHNKTFDIETDASDYQLGAVIKQDGRPVAYYTRKLNSAQKNYTTIEKEILSIVATLREFRTMLLGAKINVYTDHRNLTHNLSHFTTQRVMRWRLLLEEYTPNFFYIPGPQNVVADALSRVPTSIATFFAHLHRSAPSPSFSRSPPSSPSPSLIHTDPALAECLLAMPACDAHETDGLGTRFPGDPASIHHDCLLFHPRFDARGNQPFHFSTIHFYQQQDPALLALNDTQPLRFFFQKLGSYDILCHRLSLNDTTPSPWLIALPTAMLVPLAHWYHNVTVHTAGMDRLEAMIRRNFSHPDIRNAVRDTVSSCPICPRVRLGSKPTGQLAPRDAPIAPWSEVHVDFIGPWPITVNGIEMTFNALTCVDPVTNLLEISRLRKAKTADNARELFENEWLSRYPRPLRIVHDHGPEFDGHDFQFPLDYAGIKPINISPNTPTANSIIESSHRSIGQVIRTLVHTLPPTSAEQAESLVDSAIATAMHAHRCSPNSSLNNFSPGAIVFQRDMFLDIPLITDILTLTRLRQAKIDQRLLRANARRLHHEYTVGQQVFVKTHDRPNKLSLVRTGPFPILQVHTNNTVTIQRGPIHERISIRHLLPFKPSAPAPALPT